MRFYTTRPFQIIFPQALWKTSSPHVHLTFDDGPHPRATPGVLEVLESFGAKATFFVLGKNVREHPEIARKIVEGGHIIANHSYDHPNLLFAPSETIRRQISEAEDSIVDACGARPTYFRPPFGFFDWRTIRVARQCGYRLAMWTVDPGDHEPETPENLLRRMRYPVKPGSIILLHDSERTADKSAHLVRSLLTKLGDQGIQCAPLAP